VVPSDYGKTFRGFVIPPKTEPVGCAVRYEVSAYGTPGESATAKLETQTAATVARVQVTFKDLTASGAMTDTIYVYANEYSRSSDKAVSIPAGTRWDLAPIPFGGKQPNNALTVNLDEGEDLTIKLWARSCAPQITVPAQGWKGYRQTHPIASQAGGETCQATVEVNGLDPLPVGQFVKPQADIRFMYDPFLIGKDVYFHLNNYGPGGLPANKIELKSYWVDPSTRQAVDPVQTTTWWPALGQDVKLKVSSLKNRSAADLTRDKFYVEVIPLDFDDPNPGNNSWGTPAVAQPGPAVPGGAAACPGAPTITFNAAPTTIPPGQSATLSWSVTNATEVLLVDGTGKVESVSASGTKTVKPTDTTFYNMNAVGCGTTALAQVRVEVKAACSPPTILFFSASPDTIAPGHFSELKWGVADAPLAEIDQGIGQLRLGSPVHVNPTKTTTYTLKATGCVGPPATKQVTVTVQAAGAAPAPPVAPPAPGLVQVLTGFMNYWVGEYWEGFPAIVHYASFCFYKDGRFNFHVDGKPDDTGKYSLVTITGGGDTYLITFRVTNDRGTETFDGMLDVSKQSGQEKYHFFMQNGPPGGWKTIKYAPSGTCQ
jgi:hypothetical protein